MPDLEKTTLCPNAKPPTGTAIGSSHYLTYHGAKEPSEWWWSGTGWRSAPGGWGTKVHAMTVTGWRYLRPGPVERSEQALAVAAREARERTEYARLREEYGQ